MVKGADTAGSSILDVNKTLNARASNIFYVEDFIPQEYLSSGSKLAFSINKKIRL